MCVGGKIRILSLIGNQSSSPSIESLACEALEDLSELWILASVDDDVGAWAENHKKVGDDW